MGRPRKPLKKLQLVGTDRPDRHGERADAVDPAPSAGTPPQWMTEDAHKHWPDIAAMLAGLGLMSDMHSPALALLCESLARYLTLRDMIADTGYSCESATGAPYQHPLVGAMNKAWEQVYKILREFGMTPAALRGVNTAAPKDKSDGKGRFFG